MKKILTVVPFLGLAVATAAQGAVGESSASALSSKQVATVAAAPAKVWAAFVQIERWWSSEHTYSGSAANLRLAARPGGCFCETLPHGGGVQHMTVIFVTPNERMTLSGGLGPLQTAGVSAMLTFELTPKGSGTEMSLIYNVGGFYPGGLSSIAAGVDGVLAIQFGRLQRLIATGDANEKKAP